MRVMLDTNVILSLAIFRSRTIQRALDDIAQNHELLLCTYVIDEVHEGGPPTSSDPAACSACLLPSPIEHLPMPGLVGADAFHQAGLALTIALLPLKSCIANSHAYIRKRHHD